MDWINYNHLFYFWTVARQGSISRASLELRVSQPTISEQLRKLEETLGVELFERVGRGLRLTDAGQNAFSYAEKIFRLGREMADTLQGQAPSPTMRLVVGIAQSLPKLVAYQLIAPALKSKSKFQIACIEDHPEALYARLAVHQVDMVLSESAMPPSIHVRGYHHLLRRSGITFFSARGIRPKGAQFPANLDGQPFLMPEANTRMSHALQHWFESRKVRPQVVGEFSDSALLKVFGQAAVGCFAAPTIVERDVQERYKVEVVGRTRDISEEFYAITTERRLKHPGVLAITKAARTGEKA